MSVEIPEFRSASRRVRASCTAASGLPDGIVLNLRTLAAAQSGVQRYAGELARHVDPAIVRLRPRGVGGGVAGQLWEQFVLPWRVRGRLLLSPGNSGPWLMRRQVVTMHDASTFDCADAFTGWFGRWYRWLLPQLARRALGIITVSRFSRDRLAACLRVPAEKIVVVHNGVTPPPARPDPADLAAARRELGLPPRFLLFVGSRDPRKNAPRLVAAFQRLAGDDVHLVLAGGGNRRLFSGDDPVGGQPRVHVLGHVSESHLECLYHLAEGFVFPSLYEGFGLPPLEAMARGCPVVCSNATCLPEVCGPAWEEGGACLYFFPESVDSIAAALEKFLALAPAEKARMAAAGRTRAASFTWSRCARETLEAVRRFAAEPTSGNRLETR